MLDPEKINYGNYSDLFQRIKTNHSSQIEELHSAGYRPCDYIYDGMAVMMKNVYYKDGEGVTRKSYRIEVAILDLQPFGKNPHRIAFQWMVTLGPATDKQTDISFGNNTNNQPDIAMAEARINNIFEVLGSPHIEN